MRASSFMSGTVASGGRHKLTPSRCRRQKDCPLRALLDAAQHSLTHDEADELDGLHEQRGPTTRIAVAFAHQEPGGLIRLAAQDEGPREVIWGWRLRHRHSAAQDQRPPCLHAGHDQADLGIEVDLVADVDGLPFGDDPVGANGCRSPRGFRGSRSCRNRRAPGRVGRSMARHHRPRRQS
jgi:hypothetical protein